jgi:hypothetical protein
MFKTNEKQFKIYKKEVKKWIKIFGLYGWTIKYIHDQPILGDGLAGVLPDLDARTVVFILNEDWVIPPKKKDIKLVAFHEVMELLLFRLNTLAKARYMQSEYDIDEEIHNIIKIFENRIFKKWHRQKIKKKKLPEKE